MTPCRLWPGTLHKAGYGVFYETVAGRRVQVLAHRRAYETAIGPIPAGLCVLHRCDTPACTEPAHLFVGSRAENARDRDAKLRQARGHQNGRAKLTTAQVHQIRVLLATGAKQADVGAVFGVSQTAVSKIARRKRWAHA